MSEPRLRHELKHVISYSDYLSLRSRLKAVMSPDSHAGEAGEYSIRSLYFDNPDNAALREKLDGVSRREKFRLRYYNGDSSFIRLEKKSKQSGLCGKRSAPVTREQCERLLAGDTDWMRESGSELLRELHIKMRGSLLRPATIVDYVREPYVYPPGNVRVTFDREVRTGLASRDFFNADLPTLRASPGGAVILEVKYDEFLPDLIRDLIQVRDRRSGPFSKYAACRLYG